MCQGACTFRNNKQNSPDAAIQDGGDSESRPAVFRMFLCQQLPYRSFTEVVFVRHEEFHSPRVVCTRRDEDEVVSAALDAILVGEAVGSFKYFVMKLVVCTHYLGFC